MPFGGVEKTAQWGVSFWMAVFSGAGIILLVLFQWLILGIVGPGKETDAFFAAMMVPELFQAVVTGSLTHVLVPLFATAEPDRLNRDASTFLFGIGGLFLILFLVLSFTAPYWVPWAFPGFDPKTLQLTVLLVRIQLFGMVLTALSAVLMAVSNAQKRFIRVEASTVLASGAALLLLAWGLPRHGIVVAAWAMCLRPLVQLIVLAPELGFPQWPDLQSGTFRKGLRRLYPLLCGTSFYKTEILLDRFLASMAPPGQLSIFQFARQVYSAGNTVLGKAIVTPMVPLLAEKAAVRDWDGFQRIGRNRLLTSVCLCALFFIPFLVIGKPAFNLLLGHGRFDEAGISLFFRFLVLLAGLWFGGAAGQVLSTVFYAKGDTATPTRIGIFAYIFGVAFKAAGFYWGGINGLACGTSLYFIVAAAWLYWGLAGDLGDP